MLNVLQGISIHHAAGRGQNRAGEWFLLLSSQKTLQTGGEQERGWTEALSSSSPSSVPGCRAMYGEILPEHIQSYWTWIILLVTSPFASWALRFPTLKFPICLAGLAALPCSLCSGQPAGAAVSLFPWAPPLAAPTPRSALPWPDPATAHLQDERMNIPLTHAMQKAGAGRETPKAAWGSTEL